MQEEKVKVLIRCCTYNHEKYIAQALDGFVMQQTNFKFVAIVHDDASTDRTAEIVKEYAEKYPDIIKPIFETENLYSKHNGSLRKVMNEACSQFEPLYIAVCEGDDYWTDPYKLQKQVDFLDTHPDFVVCSCVYNLYYQNTNDLQPCDHYRHLSWKKENNVEFFEYSIELYTREWFTQPLTTLYRNGSYLNEIPAEKYTYYRDSVFYYYVLKQGKGVLLKDVMGVYRKHDGGMYTGKSILYNKNITLVTYIELYKNNDDIDLGYSINWFMDNLISSLQLKKNLSYTMGVLKLLIYYIRKAPLNIKLQLLKQYCWKWFFLDKIAKRI